MISSPCKCVALLRAWPSHMQVAQLTAPTFLCALNQHVWLVSAARFVLLSCCGVRVFVCFLCASQVKQIVKELVATRKRMLLVQAVSQLRQRRPQDVASSLNNLLSCNRALPEKTAMAWTEHAELKEVRYSY